MRKWNPSYEGLWLLRLLTFLWCFNSATWSQGTVYSLKRRKKHQSILIINNTVSIRDIGYFIDSLLFLVIPRSPKSGSQNIAFLNFFKSYFTFAFVITKLAVILKLLYRCCYGVFIIKQFNWQTSKAQCFDCEKICARKFQTSK